VFIVARPQIAEDVISPTRSKFTIEPLEPGFGYTVGNSLRRTLLSSIPGAAISSVRIDGVLHEFATVERVTEDVTDIILNLKELVVRSDLDEPTPIYLKAKGPAEVTAGDVAPPAGIEISLYDTAVSALVNVSGTALVTGEEPGRYGNAHPSIVPYQTFAAADGLISVAGANDGLYRRLCEAIERPDLAQDERYATNPLRVANREELVDELERVFAARPADEWLERLGRAGVPAGKVRGVLDALTDARTLTVEHPTIGTLPLIASPLGPRAETRPPPLLGQHTREVLAELGYDDEHRARLHADGVV